MKKIIGRWSCMLIAVCMCFCVLVACGGGEDGKETVNGALETTADGEATAFSTVRKKDYDEYAFNIMYFAGQDGLEKDFVAEGLTGEVLNDRVFKKNQVVTQTYNIVLKLETMTTDELYPFIRNNSLVGDSPYDVYGINRNGISLCYEGYFLDLTMLDDIDMTKEWWDQKWINSMTVNDSLFSLVGDFSIGSLQSLSCLCFNKDLFDDRQLEHPYAAVRAGEWTYEKMLEYVKDATQDLDDNNKYNEDDFYGLAGWGTEASYALFYGSGFSFARTGETGDLEISYNMDTLTQVYDYIHRIWNVEKNYRNDTGDSSQHSYPWDIFKADRSLFLDTTLLKIGLFLSDMESEYGVIPSPKLNTDQTDYSSYSSYTIPMTCVAVNTSDPQRTGNIIEAFCTASYDMVTPDIFSIVTKLQNVNDPDSAEMVDIIIRTKMFDPAHWYVLSGYTNFCRAMLKTGSTNISSYLKGYTKPAPAEIENINKLYKESQSKNQNK